MRELVHTFHKEERLHSGRLIELLFKKGKSFTCYPLKAVWIYLPQPGIAPVQMLVTVPKRNFKKAVSRNLLKRRIREAFRLNKYVFNDNKSHNSNQLVLALVYIAPDALPFGVIQEKIILILQRLTRENEETAG